MIPIQETKRWNFWQDKLVEQEYRRSQGLDSVDCGTRKIKENIIRQKKGYKNLKRFTKQQIFKIFQKI
jgi:hypothetical protein